MSFWSTERLRERQTREKLIDPFDLQRIKHGAYELSLGSEAFISTAPTGTKQKLDIDEQLTIPPGQFGLLLTEEIVAVPKDTIGFISIRFSIKLRGLVNVSGFHVDPGFTGRLKFAVYNAGSQNIVLSRGERVFIIWFSELSESTKDGYNGEHASQKGITSDDVMHLQGEVASPADLKKQIDELRSEYERRLTVLDNKITTLIAISIAILILFFGSYIVKPTASSNSNVSSQGTSSKEPVQDEKQNEPSVNENTDNSANTSSNTPATKPEPTK
jgi:dCTP deaminase